MPVFDNPNVYPITHEMPNGDIFFYVWIIGNQEEHHYTYWYRKAENMFTEPQHAGVAPVWYLGGDLQALNMQVFEEKAQLIFGYSENFTGDSYWHLRAITITDSIITAHNMGQFHISRHNGAFRFAGLEHRHLLPESA
ncbi:MAG: hypothetical protein LRZ88_00725 [Candidatus Cloacimonetes bacterium]|nr:hypothetical protein [Candidatus Cloacimonadota bacterium]